MTKQFSDVSSRYGAPMGRRSDGYLETEIPNFVRLFRVRLDAGGYDDGGAYWGTGTQLWCAEDDDGNRQFVRAYHRERAALMLGIPDRALKRKLYRHGLDYGLALLDGRAPMPPDHAGAHNGEKTVTRAGVLEWMHGSGHYHDGTPAIAQGTAHA